jgi:ParB/RepB/Spo0J family partition protein
MTQRAPNVQYLPIDQLIPAEDNFRGPVGDVTELADSIRAVGILQHLVVSPKADGGYRLVFGHRRLEAARQAGLTEVPAEIRDYSDVERFTAMFAENYGRKDLSPLQEARAYQAMLELVDGKGRKVFTQRSLAKRLGVGQAKVSNYTGIFKLPERVVTMLEQGELNVTEAVLLVRLAKHPDRVEAAWPTTAGNPTRTWTWRCAASRPTWSGRNGSSRFATTCRRPGSAWPLTTGASAAASGSATATTSCT